MPTGAAALPMTNLPGPAAPARRAASSDASAFFDEMSKTVRSAKTAGETAGAEPNRKAALKTPHRKAATGAGEPMEKPEKPGKADGAEAPVARRAKAVKDAGPTGKAAKDEKVEATAEGVAHAAPRPETKPMARADAAAARIPAETAPLAGATSPAGAPTPRRDASRAPIAPPIAAGAMIDAAASESGASAPAAPETDAPETDAPAARPKTARPAPKKEGAEPAPRAEAAPSTAKPDAADRITARAADGATVASPAARAPEILPVSASGPGGETQSLRLADGQIVETRISVGAPHQPGATPPLVAIRVIQREGGAKSIEIRLDPPELGQVDVKLETGSDGRLRAVLSTDRADAFELLKRESGALENALRDAGVQLGEDGLSFSLNDQGGAFGGLLERQAAYGGSAARNDSARAEDDPSPILTNAGGWRRGALDISV